MQMGDLENARDVLEEARRLRDPVFGPRLLGLFDNHAALVRFSLGDLPEAHAHALEFLTAARTVASSVDEMMALSILVDVEVAMGKGFAGAAAEMLERYQASPHVNHIDGGLGLRCLAGALVMADRLDEAESMYRVSSSLLRRSQGTAAPALYDAAMLIARRGRLEDAARVFAYADAIYAARRTRPRPAALKLKSGLLALLAGGLAREKITDLFDEGRRLNESDACAMAFPPPTSSTQEQTVTSPATARLRTTEARRRGAQ
jgi:tetratricopeptide (TPR) repeat protein